MGARHPSHAIAAVVCLLVLLLEVCNAQPGDIAAVVAPSVTTDSGTAPRTPAYSTSTVCAQLRNGDRVACNDFYSSLLGTNRAGVLYARLTWENEYPASYACSGLNTLCTNIDARSPSRSGTSSCRPKPDGAPCGPDNANNCMQGMCVGRASLPVEELPSAAPASIPLLGGETLIKPAAAGTDTIVVGINTGSSGAGPTIPRGFCGTSHEWGRLADYCNNEVIPGAWMNIFKNLGPRAVLRVGGFSTEALTDVPDDAQFNCLLSISQQTGARWIIGVNSYRNNITLTRAMTDKARNILGAYFMGAELGNEPKYWPDGTKIGGWNNANQFVLGDTAWADWYDRVARQLTGCPRADGSYGRIVYGPAWDNLNTISDGFLQGLLKRDPYYSPTRPDRCYTQEVTLHYYPYISRDAFTRATLLSEDLMRNATKLFLARVAGVNGVGMTGLRVRLGEVGSLAGGKVGVSDVAAATFWTADFLFEMANAGATGVNFHWGVGGDVNPTTGGSLGGPPYVGVQTNFVNFKNYPSVHTPWFGYLFFQRVVAPQRTGVADTNITNSPTNVARFVRVLSASATGGCAAGVVKVWPVLHTIPGEPSELRIGALHKGDLLAGAVPCTVILEMPHYFDEGQLMRLETWNPSLGMADKLISIGRQNYTDASGILKPATGPVYDDVGMDRTSLTCTPGATSAVCTRYTFTLAPQSGAILSAARCMNGEPC